jgi:hypothetical protein
MLQPNTSASTTAQVVKNAPEGVTVQGRPILLNAIHAQICSRFQLSEERSKANVFF